MEYFFMENGDTASYAHDTTLFEIYEKTSKELNLWATHSFSFFHDLFQFLFFVFFLDNFFVSNGFFLSFLYLKSARNNLLF